MFEYFDIHSHLSFPDYDTDREEIISEMKKKNIGANGKKNEATRGCNFGIGTISVGVDFETSKKEVELAERHDNIFACVGQHPENLIGGFDERIAKLAENPKVVAIGECGLDYFRLPISDTETKNKQKKIFEQQIDLSLKVGKPLMLHIRPSDKINFDAYFDALQILESYAKKYGDKLRGNAHFFCRQCRSFKKFFGNRFHCFFCRRCDIYRRIQRSCQIRAARLHHVRDRRAIRRARAVSWQTQQPALYF